MISSIRLFSSKNEIEGSINLPESKSISNRVLIIKYLSGSDFEIGSISKAADSQLLSEIIYQLKFFKTDKMIFNLKNAGTPLRFLTAILATISGEFVINCDQRMKSRPIGDLVESLRYLGADIQYLENEMFPPLRINGKNLHSKSIEIDATNSSQYISALMLIAPLLPSGLEINMLGNIASKPYISLTISLMQQSGISIKLQENRIIVEKGNYSMPTIDMEFDWSSAAFFYELAAISNKASILLKGLKTNSLQGDAIIPTLFEKLGIITVFEKDGVRISKASEAKKNIHFDFSSFPDIALPFIVSCAALGVIGTFTGLESLKIKECNRVEALSTELSKFDYDFRDTGLGEWVLLNSCAVDIHNIKPKKIISIETYGDHRVAMAFAPLVLISKELKIKNPEVVAKSFPNFWNEFGKIVC
ncbi:MAG: hypothetical protein AUJ98_09845 [Bacteroidetes bacterium CG2_30_33_31]|nr:MAG: hypothetical protein AUJ98_09845 [Bacteroidetes bacterium CG2_30_33_31]